MKLIPEWRRAWRMASVQISAVAAVFGLLQSDQQAAMLAWVGLAPDKVPVVIGALFMLARLVHQPKVRDDQP